MPVSPEFYTVPNGGTANPGLPFASAMSTGFRLDSSGNIVLVHQGSDVATIGANGLAGGVQTRSILFQAAGAHVFTGTIPLPAGTVILDVQVHGIALWTAATSASIIVGDDVDPDGFWAATDLKATDLLAGEANTIEHPGGKAGAYIVSEQRLLYQATARNVVAVVTQVGASNTGTTLLVVSYVVPTAIAPVTTS